MDRQRKQAEAGLIYLASPYSHPDPAVQEQRFNAVCWAAARLMRDGHLIFSPIAHTHPIAQAGGLPGDWEFWRKYDHAMLDVSAELWVLRLDGWEQSQGVKAEIEYMRGRGKPVRFIDAARKDGEE